MNALLETLSCVYYHFIFPKINERGVGIKAGGGLENFSKICKRAEAIIRYSRVVEIFLIQQLENIDEIENSVLGLLGMA